MKTAILAIILLAAAAFLLSVKIIFKKGGRFPTGHAHDIPELRHRGIGCPHDNDDSAPKRH